MKYFISFCILLLQTIATKAQEETTIPSLNNIVYGDTCDIRCVIARELDRDVSIIDYPLNFVCSIKFKIDTIGNVTDIEGNEITPVFLFDYIKKILISTNGKWTPSIKNGLKVKSKPFILPIVFRGKKDFQIQSKKDFDEDTWAWVYGSSKLISFDSSPLDSIPKTQDKSFSPMIWIKPWLSTGVTVLDCYFIKPLFITPGVIY